MPINYCFDKKYKEDIIIKQAFFEPENWAEPIQFQITQLQSFFSGIKIDQDYIKQEISKSTKKGFVKIAIPKITFLGRLNNIDNPYKNIGILIEQVCEKLKEQKKDDFTHYRKGQLSSKYIRCIKPLIEKRKTMEDYVPGDILILDISLGSNYVGWTPRKARENIIHNPNELALSILDLLWIVLINPKRFTHCDDLSVDSVMEEYFSEDRSWECILFIYFRGGKLEFGYRWGRRAYFDSGAAIAII